MIRHRTQGFFLDLSYASFLCALATHPEGTPRHAAAMVPCDSHGLLHLFRPRTQPAFSLFDFLDFLEFALLVGDPRMAREWKPKKTHDDGVLPRGITPLLLHLAREATMKCSHKIDTYPPTCAVHNVVLVKFSEEMDEEYNPPGLGHVRCYFCPVGHNFVLIADVM